MVDGLRFNLNAGSFFINKIWTETEAAEYISDLQAQGKLLYFSSTDEMFT